MQLRRAVGIVVATLLVLATAIAGVTYYRVVWRWSPLTPVARSFLEAARARDTTALRAAAIEEEPVWRALAMAQAQPGQLDTLIASLRIRNGEAQGPDTVIAMFRTRSSVCQLADGHPDEFTARFVRRDGKWQIAYAGMVC